MTQTAQTANKGQACNGCGKVKKVYQPRGLCHGCLHRLRQARKSTLRERVASLVRIEGAAQVTARKVRTVEVRNENPMGSVWASVCRSRSSGNIYVHISDSRHNPHVERAQKVEAGSYAVCTVQDVEA